MKIALNILILIMFSCGTPKSQLKGGCKLKVDKIDDFTKEHIKQTRAEILTVSGMGFGTSTNVWARKVDETLFLGLQITSSSVFSIHKGDHFKLLFDDDTVLELDYNESEVADFNYLSTLNASIWSVQTFFRLSEEETQKLLNKNIKKIRINFSDSYFDDDVKDLRQDNIYEVLNCILSN